MNEQPENIEGINVVDSIKYLGVTINNTRKCFTRQKRIMIEKAQKMAQSTYSIIHKKKKKVARALLCRVYQLELLC